MLCPSCGSEIPDGFRFCGQCGAKIGEPAPSLAGQRRHVAVLFADISGFTAMSEKLDPEDVHRIMNSCFEGIGTAIQEEGGYIDKYIGDNVMALFGAPTAHEDDPARACRAALAIQEFLREYSRGLESEIGATLRARVGIHYGLVVAGGVGSEVRMDYTVMGDTVNLASRLESAAPPGSVLVSAEIHTRVGAAFDFAEPVQLTVKGKRRPVQAFELLREMEIDSAAAVADDSPLLGRDAELAQLRDHLRSGARCIEVRGEIGVGKTRLVLATLADLPERQPLVVSATASVTRRPLGLFRRLLRHVLATASSDAPPESEERFNEALLALSPRLDTYAGALWFLAAPTRLAVPRPQEEPETFRRTVERGAAVLLDALGRARPQLVLFIDSYELCDDASADLLEGLARDHTLLIPPLVLATRPTARPPCGTALTLEPLANDTSEALLDALRGDLRPSPALRADILRRAGGVPLFLEEIVHGLLESGSLPEGEPEDGGTEEIALPASLRAAMVSRLDRLPESARALLGRCSVQGSEFQVPVLQRVCEKAAAGAGVANSLRQLRDRGILALDDSLAAGRFVQPLMQEACYGMLLLRDRKDLHSLTARALVDLAGGPDNVEPELLAFHEEHAENWADAADARLRAAERNADLFLNEEALEGWAAVAALLDRDPEAPRARRTRLLALRGSVRVHIRTGAYADATGGVDTMDKLAINDIERAECDRLRASILARTGHAEEALRLLSRVVSTDVAGSHPNPELTSLAWYGLAELQHRAGKMDDALYALRCCRATAAARENRTTLRADLLAGLIAHTRGLFEDARRAYGRALAAAQALGVLAERARALNNLGNVARDEGDYTGAAARYTEALELWSRIGDSECIAGAHNNLGNLAMSRGQADAARDHYERSLDASLATGNVNGAALAHANLAILALENEDAAGAATSAQAALAVLAGAAHHILRGLVEVVLGDACLLLGDAQKAEAYFQKVLAEFTPSNHPLAVATAQRGLGRVLLARGDCEGADRLFRRAAAAFQRLQRSQEEARTLLDQARASARQGDPTTAAAHAQEALRRFETIDATRDIARAQAFLREISPAASAGSPVK